jgi:hypothetical protein
MIRIAQTPNQHGKLNKARILTAILHAFQQTHPDCYISPKYIDAESQPFYLKLLHRATDIPTDHNSEHYLEQPDSNTSGQFRARILLHSSADLHILKRSPELLAWLKNENIAIDRNPPGTFSKTTTNRFFHTLHSEIR